MLKCPVICPKTCIYITKRLLFLTGTLQNKHMKHLLQKAKTSTPTPLVTQWQC